MVENDLHSARHFFLYAKYWYQRGDVLEDLRKLVADYTGSDPKHISDNDVLTVVCDITLPYLLGGANPAERVRELLGDLIWMSQKIFQDESRALAIGDVVRLVLSILTTVPVMDEDGSETLKLGDPDYSILPGSRKR